MRYLLLDHKQLQSFSLLNPEDKFEINEIEQTVISFSHPEQDCTFMLTSEGTVFLQGNRFSFTKKPKKFPWINFPAHLESVNFK